MWHRHLLKVGCKRHIRFNWAIRHYIIHRCSFTSNHQKCKVRIPSWNFFQNTSIITILWGRGGGVGWKDNPGQAPSKRGRDWGVRGEAAFTWDVENLPKSSIFWHAWQDVVQKRIEIRICYMVAQNGWWRWIQRTPISLKIMFTFLFRFFDPKFYHRVILIISAK